jgi:hypothetical protein
VGAVAEREFDDTEFRRDDRAEEDPECAVSYADELETSSSLSLSVGSWSLVSILLSLSLRSCCRCTDIDDSVDDKYGLNMSSPTPLA